MSKVKSYYGGSTSHYYTYNGSTLVQEKIVTSGSQTTEYLTFLYNSEGPTGFVYNNTLYTYRKNIFGDIIAVYNGTSKVAEYAYDAYGNCRVITGSNIGTLNPFRYRGYYFDEDMKLYYLQSRYYDPETGRFINADDVSYLDPETIHGLNLYTYCVNSLSPYQAFSKFIKKLRTLNNVSYSPSILSILSFDYKNNHRNPNRARPNSVGRIYYPNGVLKQEREYGPDGKPVVDHDHHSGEDVGFDHDHDWDWDKNPPRQPAREPSKIVATLGLIRCGVVLLWLVGNDITGIGVADDGVIPAVATTFISFLIILIN